MTSDTTLVWFRQDLRLRDNPALSYACEQGAIVPVYIVDTTCPDQFKPGGASNWWLHHSLTSLNQQLGGHLICLAGDPALLIPEMLQKTGASRIVWNRCYEPWQINRDKALKALLKENHIDVLSFNGSLLWEPWQVLKKDSTPYKVFTPYYRKGCLNQDEPRMPLSVPESIQYAAPPEVSGQIANLKLMPKINWYRQMESQWQPGEEGAATNLQRFLTCAVGEYKSQRDIPSVQGTSHLSPHLHFGELSPNQVWHAAISNKGGNIDCPDLDCFLSELGWREFSYYLLYHFPHITNDNFNANFNLFPWAHDEAALEAWQKGTTGIPIVDAGMRELWQTGYMHNRVRMIVGSFLVKNLLIDWRHGERWFWDCLLDADLASNCASWQWVAGSGADAAPYFRIFNPLLQGEKFDPEGKYVSRYCPELASLPKKYIHQPWNAPQTVLDEARLTLGENYPQPIVDLKISRQRALDAFSALKALTNTVNGTS